MVRRRKGKKSRKRGRQSECRVSFFYIPSLFFLLLFLFCHPCANITRRHLVLLILVVLWYITQTMRKLYALWQCQTDKKCIKKTEKKLTIDKQCHLFHKRGNLFFYTFSQLIIMRKKLLLIYRQFSQSYIYIWKVIWTENSIY